MVFKRNLFALVLWIEVASALARLKHALKLNLKSIFIKSWKIIKCCALGKIVCAPGPVYD